MHESVWGIVALKSYVRILTVLQKLKTFVVFEVFALIVFDFIYSKLSLVKSKVVSHDFGYILNGED